MMIPGRDFGCFRAGRPFGRFAEYLRERIAEE